MTFFETSDYHRNPDGSEHRRTTKGGAGLTVVLVIALMILTSWLGLDVPGLPLFFRLLAGRV